MRELCDRHGALLICDEVAVGFGRTGRMFACEHEDVAPDLLCLAKGITGGYLPLAATLATEEIYEGFLGEHEEFRTFFHGHTYTGNPLACAAALATLDVFEEERTLERLQPKIELLGELLAEVEAMPQVAEVRRRGFMTGIELGGHPVEERMGHRVTLEARRRGRDHPPAGRHGDPDAAAGDLRGRAAPAGGDHRRGDRGGDRRRVGGSCLRPEAEVCLSPRVARSPSCGRRRPGRTSRPGCPRRPSRRDAAVGVALLGVVDEPAAGADPLLGGRGLAHGREI